MNKDYGQPFSIGNYNYNNGFEQAHTNAAAGSSVALPSASSERPGFRSNANGHHTTLGFGKPSQEQRLLDELNVSDDEIEVCGETSLKEWTPYDPSSSRPPKFTEIKNWIQELRTQRLDSELHLPSTIRKSTRADVHEYCRKLGLQSVSYGRGSSRYMVIRPKMCANIGKDRMLTAAAEKAIKFGFEEINKMAEIKRQYPATDDDVRQIQLIEKSKHLHSDHSLTDMACLPVLRARPVPGCRVPERMGRAKQQLPITRHRQRILDALQRHDVVLISGGTGTGKSTQVPQYVLEQAQAAGQSVRVVCTQPRRLPAITVAERVAAERGEQLGATVGYHIRLKRKLGKDTVLTFCTPGVLLRTIKTKRLSDVTHVFLDEVHERDMETDYLLAVLKDIQELQRARRMQPVKIVLMSATMQANLQLFTAFFPNVVHVEVEGRMFDVDTYHLEDVLSMIQYKPEKLVDVGMFDASQMFASTAAPDIDDWSVPPAAAAAAAAASDADVELIDDNDEVVVCPAEPMPPPEPDVDLQHCLPSRFEPDAVNALMPIGRHKQAANLLADYRSSRDALHLVDRTDLELAAALAVYINNSPLPGAILVFLTGYDDINSMRKLLLDNNVTSRCTNKWEIFMLHSEMDARHQHQVFEHSARGTRKIILSTNIAEASLTIDDVVFVIDCGRVKEKRYYPKTHISTLLPVSIAKSNAEQRRGRAGRCQRGYCFRLYSRDDYDLMPLAATPEIKRIAIHEICLHARQMADDEQSIAGFLSKCPEPPAADAIDESVQYLKLLSALTSDEQLTSIGRVMTELPLDPRLTRTLLWAITLQCVEPVLTITALMSYRDPFMIPAGDRRLELDSIRGGLARTDLSDHIMYLRVFYQCRGFVNIRNRLRQYCDKLYISMQNMEMCVNIRTQLLNELCRLKLVGQESWARLNTYSASWPMVKACLVGGSHPAIGFVGDPKRFQKIKTMRESKGELAPGCALRFETQRIRRGNDFKYIRPANGNNDGDGDEWQPPPSDVRWLMYNELMQLSQRVVLKNVSAVSPLAVCLLGGTCSVPETYGQEHQSQQRNPDGDADNVFVLADWLQCAMDTQSLTLVHGVRVKLHALFIRCIGQHGRLDAADQEFVRLLHELLCASERSVGFAPVKDLPSRPEWPRSSSDAYSGRQHSANNNGYQHDDNNYYFNKHNNNNGAVARGGYNNSRGRQQRQLYNQAQAGSSGTQYGHGPPAYHQQQQQHEDSFSSSYGAKDKDLEHGPERLQQPPAQLCAAQQQTTSSRHGSDVYELLAGDSAIQSAGPLVAAKGAEPSLSGFSMTSSDDFQAASSATSAAAYAREPYRPPALKARARGRGLNNQPQQHQQSAAARSLDLSDLGINIHNQNQSGMPSGFGRGRATGRNQQHNPPSQRRPGGNRGARGRSNPFVDNGY